MTGTEKLILRGAAPADAGALAVLHRDAFPEFFLSSLGTAFLKQFYLGFAGDVSAISTVAQRPDGAIVGSIVGTTEPDGFFSRLLRSRLVPFALISARESIRRPRIIPRLLRAVRYRGEAGVRVDGALLSSICVRSDQQGQGTGRLMMEHWERSAASSGATLAYLTTDAERNDGVNAFYRRRGWELASNYRTPEGRSMNVYTKSLTDSKENLT